MTILKNINFMSEERFKNLTETTEDALYVVESNGLKPGTIVAFAANSSLDGYLICNGAAVSRTTYAELFTVIGTTYGAGDGSTTFNVPNLTDKFIQGNGTAGTVKEAGLPNISGSFKPFASNQSNGAFAVSGAFYEQKSENGNYVQNASGTSSVAKTIGFQASRSNSIYSKSSTVQPPALTMRFYIKY